MNQRHDAPSPEAAHKGQDPDFPNALQGHGKNLGLRSEPTTMIGSFRQGNPKENSRGGLDSFIITDSPKTSLLSITSLSVANFGGSSHRLDDS